MYTEYVSKYTEYSPLEYDTLHSNCMGVTRIRWNMFSTSLGPMTRKMLAVDFIRSVGKFLLDYLHGVSSTERVHIMVDAAAAPM
jgi:hypothetical protein